MIDEIKLAKSSSSLASPGPLLFMEEVSRAASDKAFSILSLKLNSSSLNDSDFMRAGFFLGTTGFGPRPGLGAVTGRSDDPVLFGDVLVGVDLLGAELREEATGRIGTGGPELFIDEALGREGTTGLGAESLGFRVFLGGSGRGSSFVILLMGGGGRARFEREGRSGGPLSRLLVGTGGRLGGAPLLWLRFWKGM